MSSGLKGLSADGYVCSVYTARSARRFAWRVRVGAPAAPLSGAPGTRQARL